MINISISENGKATIEPNNEDSGCFCFAHNVRRDEQVEVPDKARIDFGQTTDEAGALNYSSFAISNPPLWSGGSTLTIPADGIYYSEITFMRDDNLDNDDVYVNLQRIPVGSGVMNVGGAWAGETKQLDRQTGHFSIVTKFNAGDQLYLDTSSDGSRHHHIKRVEWTTYRLCCDPGVAVPSPC